MRFEFSVVAVVREGQDRPMWAGHFDDYDVPDTFLRPGVRPPASDAETAGSGILHGSRAKIRAISLILPGEVAGAEE